MGYKYMLVNCDNGFAAPLALASSPELFINDVDEAIGERPIEGFVCKRTNEKTWSIRFHFALYESTMFGIKSTE